ncbi:MAG: 5-(carboxyamino)imidazole ribonucleotide synthase [Spirochaetia bacterium]
MAHDPHTILILGGGQLGRMMAAAAAGLDIEVIVLDPTANCPAAATAGTHIRGAFDDYDAVVSAARAAQFVTVEIEHVSTAALRELARRGKAVVPAAELLETVQDKLSQRQCLSEAGVPGPRFAPLEGDTPEATAEAARSFGMPAVQKLRHGGYDGRGVAVVRETGAGALLPLEGPSLIEEHVEIAAELSVLVARSPAGEVAVYPPFEMEMDPELNLVRSVLYPASLSPAASEEASRVARAAVEALGATGLNAVELFVTKAGRVLVNEIAPRPHNSGHLTIEAAETDQFEQHLRAVLDLPLGGTQMRGPAVMRNIVGTGPEGPTTYEGVREVLALDGTHLHLYGKRRCRPGRKMGHLTVCRSTLQESRRVAAEAAARITARGEL